MEQLQEVVMGRRSSTSCTHLDSTSSSYPSGRSTCSPGHGIACKRARNSYVSPEEKGYGKVKGKQNEPRLRKKKTSAIANKQKQEVLPSVRCDKAELEAMDAFLTV
mmetsp:Transcript_123971/g.185313  ORF Transcript_123971/g.185313 Transcript_123971/m.185313 type:complete len:106 (+) Transcript_123971:164-481(+)